MRIRRVGGSRFQFNPAAQSMIHPDPPKRFLKALRLAKLGSLAFFSTSLGLTVAGVTAALVPVPWREVIYALAGATAMLGGWRLLAYVFRRIETARPKTKEQ